MVFDWAFIWILFGIFTRICFEEIARNKIYPFVTVFLCVRDILLDRDGESDEETDRYVVLTCVFRGDFNGTPPQRRSSTLTFTLTLTHTHTHTHTHDWPTVADRSSGSRFFGFCKYF